VQSQQWPSWPRSPAAYSNATNLIATGCYVVLTLLLFNIFKPASFNVVGLTLELLQFQPQGVNIGLGFHGLRDLSQR
jgi:hypothetical protein